MIVIIGLAVLLVAVIVGVLGVLSNAGPAHPLTDNFAVFGYHVTGSTGTLFLFGIVVGAVAMLGMSTLLAGARRTAARGQDARRELARSQRETAFINRDRATLLEQQSLDPAYGEGGQAGSNRPGLFRRWFRVRQPTESSQRDVNL
ncbi:hypothetical protein [Mycolicibacterium confluentis]|uniref:Uncharacterized protein n=1 Tax=Mycolicibacterium confluentis TaxID=28047 RepID=A0A7I7Y0G0_9MYCO|nr:hypothetical protein [Mycolicibacterium confluentis]MCV7319619.1 hypothetical protein [Mycolicibacterium confluentis]ORV34225.1 hypothetical protein AWB99_00880 [Mycolicibacterium confluentis]BBZ34643.1 hypothetical protein MCNF_32480 [Mycolicibacterium confluentis]